MTNSQSLPEINLDPRTEYTLAQESELKVFNNSQGKINDFSVGSPVKALLEAQAFCGGELLWYLNKTVPAVAIEFYKNVGVERNLGTKATVELTFSLDQTQQTNFTIPQGFKILTTDNKLAFLTKEPLVIPAGNISGKVFADAEQTGKLYNVAPYTINLISQPLNNLKSVVNISSAQGGTDKETINETIVRGNQQLRLRGLVSKTDYEERAVQVNGVGSRFVALGNRAADKTSYELGSVHLFGVDASFNPITNAQASKIKSELEDEIHLGSSLYVSPMGIKNITIDAVVVIEEGYLSSQVADAIWSSVKDYVNPLLRTPGETLLISEVEYQIRRVEGVKRNQSVLLDQNHLNVPLPNDYTTVDIQQFNLTILDDKGLKLIDNEVYARDLS